MRVLSDGPPEIVEHGGEAYYREGGLLVPIAACSCNAYYDPRCAVPTHRRSARSRKRIHGRTTGWWLENRLAAALAGPVLVCGQSEAREGG